MIREIRKAKPIAVEQIDQLRSVGVSEEEISRRFKDVGMNSAQRAELGLPIPKVKEMPQVEMESEPEFLKDISSFLEYVHRELVPVKSRYPDAVTNLMTWHRKINRRIDALKK